MTQYQKTPFKPPVILGVVNAPTYVFGSYQDKTGPTFGQVISDSSTGTTATVVFNILSGFIPIVGSLVTIVGTANGASNFNVTNATVTSVSTTAAGVCTIQFTSGSLSQSSTADSGQVLIPQPELGENLTGNYASIPVATPLANAPNQQGRSISASVSFPVANTSAAAEVTLQGADFDIDSAYEDVGVVVVSGAVTAGQVYNWQTGQNALSTTANTAASNPGQVNLPNYRFWRLNVSNTATLGSAGQTTIWGKIEF